MMARTHIVLGMAAWSGVELVTNQRLELMNPSLLIAGLGSLLPDLDHPQSTLGRRLLFISMPISAVFGHRGITHSLLMVAGLIVALTHYAPSGWVWPLVVGYLSHLAGDVCTHAGCPLVWPIKQRFSLGLLTSGSTMESVLWFGMILGLLWAYGVSGWAMPGRHNIHFPALAHLGRLMAG